MMIYTQTSPDVKRVIDRLDEALRRRSNATTATVWYDNETVWTGTASVLPAPRSNRRNSGARRATM
jgi:hypothetical protein